MKHVAIVGGGLAGLVAAIDLAKRGVPCTVFERKHYPFHRVCGEYISNEVIPYLQSLDAFPEKFSPPRFTRFQLTSVNGALAEIPLDLGGFGISRYSLDSFLVEKARAQGATVSDNTEVTALSFEGDGFDIQTAGKTVRADVVLGSFGKRSRLDVSLGRSFIKKRSPYVGVKYHIRTDHPADVIALHNFNDGYCGISRIEEGKTNLCYLTHRDNVKRYGHIPEMEKAVLHRNPFLKRIFAESEFLFDKPEVINEITFETKEPVYNHVLMTGDAAGMITPLCGNGMAMAIHSANVVSEYVHRFCVNPGYGRAQLEADYAARWNALFKKRLWAGRQIQNLFGREWTSNMAVQLARHVKPVAHFLMKKTHGQAF
ncbi:MAG: NAD(P)/FAD-dependent oxidoreductase [Cyclobacteriaceae bacterium]|jgi:flavin-dependent dehydrogenase|nr:NAD(P)/FAD-dependent oxidoreductase [Cyclobacteriaceae bacterium]